MLQDALPGDLRARMQERVFIESDAMERAYYPDVLVYERPGTSRAAATASQGSVVTAEPVRIRFPFLRMTESFIEITDVKSGGRVVTIL
jgi:hypothetical protein